MLDGANRPVFEVKFKGWQMNPHCIKFIQTDHETEVYRWLDLQKLIDSVHSVKKLGEFSELFEPEDGVDVQLYMNGQPQIVLCSDFKCWKTQSEIASQMLWESRRRDLLLLLMPFFIGTALWFCFFY